MESVAFKYCTLLIPQGLLRLTKIYSTVLFNVIIVILKLFLILH